MKTTLFMVAVYAYLAFIAAAFCYVVFCPASWVERIHRLFTKK